MSEKNDKWTMFKNYIHNELGITKDDIRAWLKEAVQSQAELMLKKTFDDFDMDTFVRRHIETQMRYWTTDFVRHQVANLLADRLVILSEDNEKINDYCYATIDHNLAKRIPENPNSELISGEITEPIKYVNNRVQISQELSLFD